MRPDRFVLPIHVGQAAPEARDQVLVVTRARKKSAVAGQRARSCHVSGRYSAHF
jgi:hypothetical protein